MNNKTDAGTPAKLLPLLILFTVAFILRTSGISHDLDLGRIYHPDTPKQMWAAEEFSQGRYFHTTGYRDLDGYPFFTSLLVSKIDRALTAVYDHLQAHIGNSDRHFDKIPNRLFWIARFLNATLSSLAVCILFLIARKFYGNGVAWTAAALLTISPVDISACHYATGDTAAAFFGLLTLLFAIRIFQQGRWYDYVAAAFFCLCSFSAKYYGAFSVTPVILAHIFRYKSLKELFSRQSILLGTLTGLTALAAFFITTAGARQEPIKTVQQIIGFMHYTSDFHLDEAVTAMSLPQRFIYSMKINLPVFADILSLPLAVFTLAGLAAPLILKRKQDRLIVSLPLVYILIGLTGKPASYPVYHTFVTPELMLAASLVLARLYRLPRFAPLPKIVAASALLATALYLVNYSARELFFFNNRDTRVLAKEWVADNIPPSYRIVGSRYSGIPDDADVRPGPFDGIAWVRCDFREKPEKGDPRLCAIALEDQQTVFRNFPAEVYLAANGQIAANHTMPLFNWVPSQNKTRLILCGIDCFFKTPRIFTVEDYDERILFSTNRIESVLVAVAPLPRDTRVKVQLTNLKKVWHLKWGRPGWTLLEHPRPNLPLLRNGYHYKLKIHTGKERPAQISLAVTPLEKAVLFFQLGEYSRALDLLEKTAELNRNPTLQEMHRVCLKKQQQGISAGTPPEPPTTTNLTAREMLQNYGISPDFLAKVPYVEIRPDSIEHDKKMKLMRKPAAPQDAVLAVPVTATNLTHSFSTGFLALPAGDYLVTIHCPASLRQSKPLMGIKCRMTDNDGNILASADASPDTTKRDDISHLLQFRFHKPPLPPAVNFEFNVPAGRHIRISRITIHPQL